MLQVELIFKVCPNLIAYIGDQGQNSLHQLLHIIRGNNWAKFPASAPIYVGAKYFYFELNLFYISRIKVQKENLKLVGESYKQSPKD